jgi:hypothetical protein
MNCRWYYFYQSFSSLSPCPCHNYPQYWSKYNKEKRWIIELGVGWICNRRASVVVAANVKISVVQFCSCRCSICRRVTWFLYSCTHGAGCPRQKRFRSEVYSLENRCAWREPSKMSPLYRNRLGKLGNFGVYVIFENLCYESLTVFDGIPSINTWAI